MYKVGKTPSSKQRLANVAISGEKTTDHDFSRQTGILSKGEDFVVARFLIKVDTSKKVTGEGKEEREEREIDEGGIARQVRLTILAAMEELMLANF